MVTVQMIRCDIQDRTDTRTECLNRLKLKTAHLCHDHRIFCCLKCHTGIRISNISNYICILCIVLHDLTKQGSCRRLSVGSGNRKNLSLSCFICQFDFPPDRDSPVSHLIHNRKIGRNSRTHNNLIQCLQQLCLFFVRKCTKKNLQTAIPGFRDL